MAKVALYDLKDKLHTFQLPNGSVLKIFGRKDRKVIDKSQLTDTMKREAKAGLLAISNLPDTATTPVSVQRQTSKNEAEQSAVDGKDKSLDKKDDTNKGNKNKSSNK